MWFDYRCMHDVHQWYRHRIVKQYEGFRSNQVCSLWVPWPRLVLAPLFVGLFFLCFFVPFQYIFFFIFCLQSSVMYDSEYRGTMSCASFTPTHTHTISKRATKMGIFTKLATHCDCVPDRNFRHSTRQREMEWRIILYNMHMYIVYTILCNVYYIVLYCTLVIITVACTAAAATAFVYSWLACCSRVQMFVLRCICVRLSIFSWLCVCSLVD